ncbi:hypothetical protein EWM64_g4811 [Hericium alpestre]|uniref:Nuclear pore protein n=1 Tax=Hericium alpestre TaxID=135208 RepID=A0A4Z0A087_9AGAM|nr:hypothetical protein EWM64_g4811 [Hericium alpestre]
MFVCLWCLAQMSMSMSFPVHPPLPVQPIQCRPLQDDAQHDQDDDDHPCLPPDVNNDSHAAHGDAHLVDLLQSGFHDDILPRTLASDPSDAYNQSDILLTLHHIGNHTPSLNVRHYQNMPEKEVSLSHLRTLFDENRSNEVRALLSQKTRITIGDNPAWVHDPNDESIRWTSEGNYLDFALAVPSGPGMGAVLPGTHLAGEFEFKMNFKRWWIDWKGHKCMLSFSPEHSMLHVGEACGLNVWLALVPRTIVEEDEPPLSVKDSQLSPDGNSRLDAKAYWAVTTYLAYCMADAGIHDAAFDMHDHYPDYNNSNVWNEHTNFIALDIMESTDLIPLDGDVAKITRRTEEFKDMHEALQRNLQTYLPLTMDCIAAVYQKVKASPVPDASRQMTLTALRRKSRSLMIFAGLLKYRLSPDIYSYLARLDVEIAL